MKTLLLVLVLVFSVLLPIQASAETSEIYPLSQMNIFFTSPATTTVYGSWDVKIKGVWPNTCTPILEKIGEFIEVPDNGGVIVPYKMIVPPQDHLCRNVATYYDREITVSAKHQFGATLYSHMLFVRNNETNGEYVYQSVMYGYTIAVDGGLIFLPIIINNNVGTQ